MAARACRHVVKLAFREMRSTANMAFSMYPGLDLRAYAASPQSGTDDAEKN